MSYKISKKAKGPNVVTVRTQAGNRKADKALKWWKAESKEERGIQALTTASFLKDSQSYRNRQSALFARMYSNQPLIGAFGGTLQRTSSNNQLPIDRPTMNVVQSCVDTLVSRITQSRPRPVFLTDNADYKQRNLAKRLNNFINGELYQTDAYSLGSLILRDASVLGTGVIKVYEENNKVCLQRVILNELLVDPNDALYGSPRSLYQVALVDRDVLEETFPKEKRKVEGAEQAFAFDSTADSSKTVVDQVLVVEAWHLPSGPNASDGCHVISCSSGTLLDEAWEKECFPFVFLEYSPRILGFFGQGLAEQLMGTQMEINKLLATISSSINLVGVPRVFVEDGSKVVKAHLNNQVGAIVTYRGTKPQYEVAPCVPAEMYQQLQRLVDYAYQQSGISALAAQGKKPDGLNSGVALREFDDLQSDRFASLVKRYDKMFIDLAYLIIDKARDIAEREGKYQTVYPNKNGTKEVDLPSANLLDNTYVIQCFDSSSLPRDPAGRLAKITELIQAGMIDIREGRRLLDYPDLQQNEMLENASEERILQILDQIVDEGEYTPPDPFMDLALAKKLSQQYYNLYVPAKLEEERAAMLQNFNDQAIALEMAAQPPMPQGAPQVPGSPELASPEPVPTTPLLPQGT